MKPEYHDDAVLTVNVLAITDGAFSVDTNQRIVTWNHAAEALLGVAPDEVVGLPCCRVMSMLGVDCCQYCPHRHAAAPVDAERIGLLRQHLATCRPIAGLVTLAFAASACDSQPRIVHVLRQAGNSLAASGQPRQAYVRQVPSPQTSPCHALLTHRELEIVRLLARGYVAHRIAGELSISYVTVRNHIAHITSKLGVSTQLQAVAAASHQGLID